MPVVVVVMVAIVVAGAISIVIVVVEPVVIVGMLVVRGIVRVLIDGAVGRTVAGAVTVGRAVAEGWRGIIGGAASCA
ncbi:hypothetical protein [Acidiphilium sp. JA12-A1]|uniref:hypothetical protein n=1 Tax=Acidiphilium sp. JA12-A1 TaxID=1464546 RepID=UPI00196893DF|nr:hypothetical protein [Acidiphilium sp. JA12-A1]